MSDVLNIAMMRREKLLAEVAKLDRFLRFAVQLTDLESAKTDEPRSPIQVPQPEASSHASAAEIDRETEEVVVLPERSLQDVMARASLFRRLNGDGELRKAVG